MRRPQTRDVVVAVRFRGRLRRRERVDRGVDRQPTARREPDAFLRRAGEHVRVVAARDRDERTQTARVGVEHDLAHVAAGAAHQLEEEPRQPRHVVALTVPLELVGPHRIDRNGERGTVGPFELRPTPPAALAHADANELQPFHGFRQ